MVVTMVKLWTKRKEKGAEVWCIGLVIRSESVCTETEHFAFCVASRASRPLVFSFNLINGVLSSRLTGVPASSAN